MPLCFRAYDGAEGCRKAQEATFVSRSAGSRHFTMRGEYNVITSLLQTRTERGGKMPHLTHYRRSFSFGLRYFQAPFIYRN